MKTFKNIIFVILFILAVPFVIALFTNKHFSTSREIEINKSKNEVFEYVRFLKNQDEYGTWTKIDPEMETYYKGTDGEVGFISGWKSENPDVGAGEQEITGISRNEKIDYELRMFVPFKTTSNISFELQEINENATLVTWLMEGKMPYPSNLFLLIMDMDAMIGSDFEEGLLNLKNILENE